MIRNIIHFGDPSISGRGGLALTHRANLNRMNITEFFGSFIVWTPGAANVGFLGRIIYREGGLGVAFLARSIYGENYLEKGGKLEHLSRAEGSKSFYRAAREKREQLCNTYGCLGLENTDVDKQLKSEALKQILSNPIKHLVVTLPIAWRGLFVEKGLSIKVPFFGRITLSIPIIISLLYCLSFAYTAFLSVKEKSWPMFGLVMPAIFLYGMHAFLTVGETRWNIPLIPLFVIFLVIQVNRLRESLSRSKVES